MKRKRELLGLFQTWTPLLCCPEGTAEIQSHNPSLSFSRPFGTCMPCRMFPGVKTPGYSQEVPPGQRNVAVACSTKQTTRFISHAFKCISRQRCLARKMCDTSIQGSGRILRCLSAKPSAMSGRRTPRTIQPAAGCSLSLRERVRVRGKPALAWQWLEGTSNAANTAYRLTTA